MKWWITKPESEDFDHVSADSLDVEHGVLVFRVRGMLILALAPGEWTSVHLDVEDMPQSDLLAEAKLVP